MYVCCECCVLSGRGLCDELITRPEKTYRLWCDVECDLETSCMRRPWPMLGRSATKKELPIDTTETVQRKCAFIWYTKTYFNLNIWNIFVCFYILCSKLCRYYSYYFSFACPLYYHNLFRLTVLRVPLCRLLYSCCRLFPSLHSTPLNSCLLVYLRDL